MENGNSLKKLYLAVVLVSFALAVGVYVYFATETPVYAARGKFSYYINTSSNQSNNMPYVSDTMTKAIADSVQTRSFLSKLYQEANIKFSSSQANKPNEYITSSVVTGSNVIQVNMFSTSKDTLGKLSLKFLPVLNESSIISQTVPRPTISITEPLYTTPVQAYPKPLEYAGLVLIGSLLVGIMFLYIFSSNEN